MNANDIINALNQVLDLGDQLDNAGGGVQGVTNGKHTTREVCKIELGQFLLYLADCSNSINDEQAAVLNLVIGDGFSEIPAYKFKELSSTISAPDPSNSLTLSAFMQGDMALSRQRGENSSALTYILINTYKVFGQLLIAMNENALAHSRYDKIISQIESRAALVGYSADDDDSSSSGDFEIDDDILVQYTGDDVDVVVPEGVTRIGDFAFSDKNSIQTIKLPNTVTVIDTNAFSHCDSLKSINLPEGVTEIESDAFIYCDSLTSLEIPSTVNVIGNDAFLFCNHIKCIRIPSTLNDIGDDAFKYCSGLETVIVYGGMRNSTVLDAMKAHFSNDVKVIWEGDEQAFAREESDSRGANNVRSKATSTGRGKKANSSGSRKTATTGSSGKKAAPAAKSRSTKGRQGGHTESYSNVITFNLPDGYRMIWEDKDDGSKQCKIVYGEYTDDNGNAAYEFMANVSDINIEGTDEDVVPDCEKLFDTIHRRDPGRRYVSLSDDPEAELHVQETPVNILGRQLKLYGLILLVQVSQNKLASVMRIGTWNEEEPDKNADSYRHMLQIIGALRYRGKALPAPELTAEKLMEQLKPDFEGKGSVITGKIGLQIKNGDEIISDSVLSGDDEGNIHIEDDHHAPSVVDGEYTGYEIVDGGISGTNEKLTRVEIPDGVTSIDDDAFEDYESLTDVIVPDSVRYIGNRAFSGCMKLVKINIPESVTYIGDYAFDGCANLTAISIPRSVTTIGDSAFTECSSLTSITLPQGIEAIADSLCDGCSSLKKIIIPESVETIGDQAFNACAALEEVTIPDGVKSIGSFAFDDCTALRSASLPGGIEVGAWAFPDEVDVTYRLGNGLTTRRKPDSTSISSSPPTALIVSDKKPVGSYVAVTPSDELYSHYGKLKRETDRFKRMGIQLVQDNGEEFQALDIIEMLEKYEHKSTNVYRKLKATMTGDNYDLDALALKVSQVFRVNKSAFDSRHDDEGDIHERLMDKKWKLSALRSFAWTLADLADREGKSIDDYDYDKLVALCSFIEEREWLNYEGSSWFDGLCGHPDIHVFYMPGKMIESGEADEICDVLKFYPVVSLDAFRSDLMQLRNPMIRLHNGILKSRNRNERLETPASAVLQAWCVMAGSARSAFFSEDGPMFSFRSYPSDTLNTKAISVGPKAAPVTRAIPKPREAEASSVMENVSNYEIVKGADGRERIKLGEYPVGSPITWLVLEKKGQELLLLSEFALDAKPFCEALSGVETTNEWRGCTLRNWLNGDFYAEAFSDEERAMILDDTHDTYKKTTSGLEETPAETDKVFLLSAREVDKYFPQERDKICKASAYAKEHRAEIEAGPSQCSWWLRSPALTMMGLSGWAPSIRADGSGKGWGIYSAEICVRPVIRVMSAGFTNASASVNTAEERKAVQEAGEILTDMKSQMRSAISALETHQENLRKQEEEKQRRIEEAKKKGKSSHDEVDMLVVLLIEEALEQLNRDESEFAQIYAEDFAAYDEPQLIRLRRKVMPTIHDTSIVDSAKADMLARPLEERFSISTANYFNVSTDWDFEAKGNAAIEATKLWYKETEIPQLQQRMEEYKEESRQDVFSQLSSLRSEWSTYEGIKGDLHISITNNDELVPEAHNLFHVKLNSDLDVQISLTNPALKYLAIPVMNVFATCWKVSPEEIWNVALQNEITDSRGSTSATRRDALAAKDKALSQIKRGVSSQQQSVSTISNSSAFVTNPNSKRIKELEESIAALQREEASIGGVFGFVKRNKIKKEIEEQQRELKSLKQKY